MTIAVEVDALFMDCRANRGNTKGLIILVSYRLARITKFFPFPFRMLFAPLRIFYVLIFGYIFCVDLPLAASIGGGCRIYHGFGLVVHPSVVIGENCVLRHGVTLGERTFGSKLVPSVGNNVEFGCNCSVLGPVKIEDFVTIGAGAVVLQDVGTKRVAVGIPAKIV